jgi:arylsulfatase A-like enzyme
MKSTLVLAMAGLALSAVIPSLAIAQQTQPVGPYKDFKGTIKLDVRDSVPDWAPFTPKAAPPGAPNILFVLYDDTGMASWSPYGGRINMPTLQRLADQGLRYTQWHTAALCSPTRSTILTGRNHHLNNMASITEGAEGFPGASGRLPAQAATIAQVLQDNGYSTFWVGKNHNVPEQDVASGASRRQWPLQLGFDRFYGFIGGETNQWYPAIYEGTTPMEPAKTPEEGYHFTEDMTNKAIAWVRQQKALMPDKPFFMYFAPGATHAPHHVPKEWADKYKGKFDQGWDTLREATFARQ